MTGNTLTNVLAILKGEIGQVGTGDDAILNQLIKSKQDWFCAKWDWSELDDRWDVAVGAGVQYLSFPTVDVQGQSATMRLDRPLDVEVLWNQTYTPVTYGITTDDYNIFNFPLLNQTQDPVQKWFRVGTDKTKFEVWPVAASPQTMRFSGQRLPIAINIASGSSIVDLDDLMLALYVATDWLKAKGKEGWEIKGNAARELFLELRANDPQAMTTFQIGRDTEATERRRVVPMKVITVH